MFNFLSVALIIVALVGFLAVEMNSPADGSSYTLKDLFNSFGLFRGVEEGKKLTTQTKKFSSEQSDEARRLQDQQAQIADRVEDQSRKARDISQQQRDRQRQMKEQAEMQRQMMEDRMRR